MADEEDEDEDEASLISPVEAFGCTSAVITVCLGEAKATAHVAGTFSAAKLNCLECVGASEDSDAIDTKEEREEEEEATEEERGAAVRIDATFGTVKRDQVASDQKVESRRTEDWEAPLRLGAHDTAAPTRRGGEEEAEEEEEGEGVCAGSAMAYAATSLGRKARVPEASDCSPKEKRATTGEEEEEEEEGGASTNASNTDDVDAEEESLMLEELLDDEGVEGEMENNSAQRTRFSAATEAEEAAVAGEEEAEDFFDEDDVIEGAAGATPGEGTKIRWEEEEEEEEEEEALAGMGRTATEPMLFTITTWPPRAAFVRTARTEVSGAKSKGTRMLSAIEAERELDQEARTFSFTIATKRVVVES